MTDRRMRANLAALPRRDFLKLAGAATAAAAAFLLEGGVARAQGEVKPTPMPASPESEPKEYEELLRERFDGDGNGIDYQHRNAHVTTITTEGRMAVFSQDPARSWTPNSQELTDFSYISLQEGQTPYGEFDRGAIKAFLEQTYGPTGPEELKMKGEPVLVDAGNGQFILNPALRTDLDVGTMRFAIPYEVLDAAKASAQAAAPAENIPPATPDAFATQFAKQRDASLTQAFAPNETPIPTPVATRTPAEIAEKASFDRMLGGFLCVLGLGGVATLLGIPLAIAASGGGGGRGGSTDAGWADPPDRYAPKTPSAEKVIERVARERFPDSK